MSLVPLLNLTLIGHEARKAEALARLQGLGCLHVLPLAPAEISAAAIRSEGRGALDYLNSVPHRRRQAREEEGFDPAGVEKRALEIKTESRKLENERDFLQQRLDDLRPWGDFGFPSLDRIKGLRLWFYLLPRQQRPALDKVHVPWRIVNQDRSFLYIVLISEQEPDPDLLPVTRVHLGGRSAGNCPRAWIRRRSRSTTCRPSAGA